MKNITKNNSMLHRMIALVMAVVMTLTLVAIDSHFHLFADEAEVAANEVDTIDVTNVLKGYSDGHEATVEYASNKSNAKFSVNKADIADIKLTTKVGDEDITVEGKDIDVNDIKYLTYKENATDDKDKLNKNPATPTDADKTSALSENVALSTEDNDNITYVALYYAYKKDNAVMKYIYMGTAKVLYDDVAPEIDVVEVNCNGALNKKSYYLVDTDGSVSITFNTLDAGSGVDKIVSIKNGSTDEVELENDRFEFRNNDESAVYRFKVYDKAGNSKELGNQIVFKRVNTTPKSDAVNLTIEPLVNQKLYPGYYITNESMMKVTAVIKDEDVTTAGNKYTGIDKMKYTLHYVLDTEDPGKNKILNTAEFTDDGEKLIATFVINSFGEDEKQIAKKLYVKVADELNNSTLWLNKYKQVVFIDSGKPSVGLSNINVIRDDATNNSGYNLKSYNELLNKWAKSVSMELAVSNNYSYIGKITYDVTGTDNKNGTLNEGKAVGSFAFNQNVTIGTTNGSTIKLDKGGEYDVTFTAESYAGGKNSATVHVCIDDVKPELVVKSAAKNDAELGNETYTIETSETLKLDYSDATSGIASAKYKVTRNGNTITSDGESDWKDVDSTKAISLADAGEYSVVIEVTDNAGNKTTKTINVKVDNVELQTSLIVTKSIPDADSKSQVDIKNTNVLNWDDVYVQYTVTGYGLDAGDIKDNTICTPYGGKEGASFAGNVSVEDGEGDGIKVVKVLYHITNGSEQGRYDISVSAKKHYSDFTDNDDTKETTLYYDITAPTSIAVKMMGSKTKIDRTYYYGPDSTSIQFEVTAIGDNAGNDDVSYGYVIDGINKSGNIKVGDIVTMPYSVLNGKKNQFCQLKLKLTDEVGNSGEVNAKNDADRTMDVYFYIDTKKPVIKDNLVYVNDTETDDELTKSDYHNTKNAKVSFTVDTCDKLSPKRIAVDVTGTRNGKKIDSKKIEIHSDPIYQNEAMDRYFWDEYFSVADEGIYELTISVKDEVGNKTSKKVKFVIDRTSPVLKKSGVTTYKINYIENNDNTLKFTISDAYGVDPKYVTVKVYYKTYDETVFTQDTQVKYSFRKAKDGSLVFNYDLAPQNDKSTIYRFEINGKDNAGNKLVKDDSSDFKEEGSKLVTDYYYVVNDIPDEYLSQETYDIFDNQTYFNHTVSYNVYVKRFLKDIATTLVVKSNNNKVGEYNCEVQKDNQVWKQNLSFKDEGVYNVDMAAVDELGNEDGESVSFVIDKHAPEIKVDQVNKINNGSVLYKVNLSDVYKGSKYAVHVIRRDAFGNIAEEYTDSKMWGDNPHEAAYEKMFDAEGDYSITVSAEDEAGNKSETAAATTFRIDKTAPVISISGMNDKQTTGVTATISIDEAFSLKYEDQAPGSSDFNVTITKKTDGTAATNVATFGTDKFSEGNPHTVSYNCSEDGEYTITASAMDLARNKAAEQTKTFKVDSKAPVLKVTAVDKDSKKVENYDPIGSMDSSTPNYVDMSLSVEEAFFATDDVKITVKKDSKDVSSSYFTNYRNSAEISTGTQRFSEDGVYEVAVTAQDELGNKADDYSLVFTVDNTPPELAATNVLDKFKAKTTKTEDGSILLNADDFADILNQGYEALWNVNDTSDFSVDAKIDGVSLIDFSDLTDGYHQLTIEVKDKVGHVSNDEFDFTYDGTAPRIVITGVEDGETVREPFTMTIGLENPDDEITSIVINGNTIDPANYSANNKYEMQVQDYDTYTIEVTAKDKAGNVASTIDEDTGAVFTFKLSEKLSPVVIVIIIIAAILLIALLIFIILASKRKKKNAAA